MYPPEPWDLRGQMYLSVFAVPRSCLPPLPGPVCAVAAPLCVGGRALVGAAWVRYEPPGVLQYRELLAAVLVREGWRSRVCISHIWVDSVPSRDGGRALWGIPKDLAEITLPESAEGTVGASASADPVSPYGTTGGRARPPVLATATLARGVRLPGRWPTPLSVIQALGSGVRRTGVRGRTALHLGRARWDVPPDGPLRHLAGRRPLWTVTLADFRMTFGAGSDRPAPA